MRYALGMDVGGTSARLAVVCDDGEIFASFSEPTGFDSSRDALLDRFSWLVEQARQASDGLPIEGVGIGMPGLQDEQGRVISASNLPALSGVDVRGEIERVASVPAAMENDMNMLAMGEYAFGGHRVAGNLLVVAVGTGVGAALVQGGKLLHVFRGSLGDPGHILVEAGGAPCRCGAKGCLESHAAGWALVALAEAAGLPPPAPDTPLTPASIFAAARSGHGAASEIIQAAARWLGMGLASFCALYQPERIVLGGNVLVEGCDLMLPLARDTLRDLVQPWMRDIPVELSRIPQTAGVLGGAALIFSRQ